MTIESKLPIEQKIRRNDIPHLATGAGILGTGGGGDPRIGRLRLQALFEDDNYPDSVPLIALDDLPNDAKVTSVAGIGAPTISVEKFGQGREELQSLQAIERTADVSIDALIAGEIGGSNSMIPLIVSLQTGIPVLDADGMGRAFPEMQMCTFFIYEGKPNHTAITDERGNQVIYRDIDSAERLENFARAATVNMGGRAGIAVPLMNGLQTKQSSIPHTVSDAIELGHAVHKSQRDGSDPIDAICEVTNGVDIFKGKITDVYRRNKGGFARGNVELRALENTHTLTIEFQNEFLIAIANNSNIIAGVPDLICVVDTTTGNPITTEALRYGQRVRVLSIPAPDLLTTDQALSVIGPSAFGYNHTYKPIAHR